MSSMTRTLAVALSAVLIATTAMAPMASAHDRADQRQAWQPRHEEWHGGERHDNAGAWVGLGVAALAGIALAANAAQPAYVPPPAYVQRAPTCTTINGYAACIGPDGTWQYVR